MIPVIIGAGIGGLCMGALLALQGTPPLILEKEGWVGGRAASFPYKGCILDNGWHASYHAQGVVGGTIGKILHMLGTPVSLSPLNPPLTMFKEGKIESVVGFRHVPPSLRPFLFRCAADIRNIPIEKTHEYDDLTVHQWASQKTTDPLLLQHFNLSSYFAITACSDQASAGEYFRVLQLATSFCDGLGYPVQGGIKTIADSLAQGIGALGGKIRVNAEMIHMEVDGDAVSSITYTDGDDHLDLSPDIVIFNPPVYNILTYTREFPSEFIDTVQAMKGHHTGPSTQVYFLLDRVLLDSHSLVLLPEDAPMWQPGTHCALFSPSLFSSTVAPPDHQLLLVAVPGTGKSVESRAQILVQEVLPDIESHLVWNHSFITPVVDGLAKHVGLVGPHRIDVHSPLHNLYFVGDTVQGTGPGMEFPAASALHCMSAVVGGEYTL